MYTFISGLFYAYIVEVMCRELDVIDVTVKESVRAFNSYVF